MKTFIKPLLNVPEIAGSHILEEDPDKLMFLFGMYLYLILLKEGPPKGD